MLLTPLVFVPVAGTVSAWLAERFPGVELSEGAVMGFAAAGALSALTMAFKWLDRWQTAELADQQAFNELYNEQKLAETK